MKIKSRIVFPTVVAALGATLALTPSADASPGGGVPQTPNAVVAKATTAPMLVSAPDVTAAVNTQAQWHHLWGPAGVWTTRNSWISNPFYVSRRSTLGVNFRCWWWRGSNTMWATITNGSGYVLAHSHNMSCDGKWKTLTYPYARSHTKYRMAIHLSGENGRNLAEVKAYEYW